MTTMVTQVEKGERFRALHAREGAFIIPNPWDEGTARLLARAGFEALATTSAGHAFARGRQDGTMTRDDTIAHVAAIVAATDLPVSADLENGFGDEPSSVAETLRLVALAGAAGGSIDDASGRAECPLYTLEHAAERVRAAAEVAHALPFAFTLTARAENYLFGRFDLKDTIARLQAYEVAGADVLYAPGLTGLDDIAAVVRALDRPVNVVMGLRGATFSLSALSAMGVKRVSVGSALARAAFGAVLSAASEMRDHGTFGFAEHAADYRELNELFAADVSRDGPG